MDTGAGDLTYCVQVLDGRSRPLVSPYAAAGVVSGRDDRDRLASDIYTKPHASSEDGREAGLDTLRRHGGMDIQQDMVIAMFDHLVMNGAGDDVARG